MKKRTLVVLGIILTLSLLATGSAFARRGDGYGMRDGRGYNCWTDTERSPVNPETMIKFRKETLPLRDELLTKRLELSQEYGKEKPDADRIANLRKEIVDIETSIGKVADRFEIDRPSPGRRGPGGYGCGYGDCIRGGF